MNKEQGALIERIQKVIALRENATTPGEAEAAAAAITRILIEHNLSMQEVEAATNSAGKASSIQEEAIDFDTDSKMHHNGSWLHRLLLCIASYNMCSMLMSGKQSCRPPRCRNISATLVGRGENITVVRITYDYLAPLLWRLSDEAVRAYAARQRRTGERAMKFEYRRQWLCGAIDGLNWKYAELEAAMKSEAAAKTSAETGVEISAENSCVGVILRNEERRISDYLKEQGIGRSKMSAARINDREAYHNGVRAGHELDPTKPQRFVDAPQGGGDLFTLNA